MFLKALAIVAGTFGTLFPERTIDLGKRAALGAVYENPGDLRPREWYVNAVRLQSAGIALAGLVAVALTQVGRDEDDGDDATDAVGAD